MVIEVICQYVNIQWIVQLTIVSAASYCLNRGSKKRKNGSGWYGYVSKFQIPKSSEYGSFWETYGFGDPPHWDTPIRSFQSTCSGEWGPRRDVTHRYFTFKFQFYSGIHLVKTDFARLVMCDSIGPDFNLLVSWLHQLASRWLHSHKFSTWPSSLWKSH